MQRVRASKTWLLLLVAVAAAGLVGWMVRLQSPGTPSLSATGDPSTSPPPAAPPPLEEVHEAARRPSPESASVAPPTAKPAVAAVTETPGATGTSAPISLVAVFVRPDHSGLEVERAHLDLIDAAGTVRSADAQHATKVEIPGVATGSYTVRVDAPGYRHREQTLDLQPGKDGKDRGTVVEARIVLWPADWIAVIVETSDRQPFSAIADSLGFEPMRLFVDAFHVHTRLDAPVPGHESVADDSTLAKFRPPPGYKSWELTKGCVGSLQLLQPPPLWVGLDLFGTNLAWELLPPGRGEIVFHLGLADLDARFARLALRVVDAADRSPVEQALVTLRADTSAHRRKDQSSVPTGPDGRLELARIVPGRYELEIFRGESQHQEMLELHTGEHRDLGDIPLGNAAGFEVLVVDSRGEPASAYVEIGPYRKGARNGDIYPQMLRHQSGAQGRCRLPMPSDPVIVRAAVSMWRSNGPGAAQEVDGVRSANVFVDPISIPPAPIRLQLETGQPVRVTTSRPEGTRFEVLDELDVVVARSVRPDEHELSIELVPGVYRLRGIAPDGSASREVPFSVQHDPAKIALD